MKDKNHLWAPWRSEYVTSSEEEEGECIFCRAVKEKSNKKNRVLGRGDKSFVMLNLYPYNCGHSMVAPYRHTGDFLSLSGEELKEMNLFVKKILEKMEDILTPHGFNVGLNLGRAAGAGIDKHLHIHIVPRWSGDTNFMPVITGDKVMSDSLDALWRKLKIEK